MEKADSSRGRRFLRKKNIAVLLLMAVILLLVYLSFSISLSQNPFSFLGEKLKGRIERKENKEDRLLAMVNGKPIYYSDLEGMILVAQLNNRNFSKKEVLQKAIERELLYQEAEKLGLTPSLEEVREELKKNIEKAKQSSEGKELLEEFLKGAEMTEEEYLSNEHVLKGFQKLLAAGRAEERLFGEKTPSSSWEAVRKKKLEDLINRAKIEILDSEFK